MSAASSASPVVLPLAGLARYRGISRANSYFVAVSPAGRLMILHSTAAEEAVEPFLEHIRATFDYDKIYHVPGRKWWAAEPRDDAADILEDLSPLATPTARLILRFSQTCFIRDALARQLAQLDKTAAEQFSQLQREFGCDEDEAPFDAAHRQGLISEIGDLLGPHGKTELAAQIGAQLKGKVAERNNDSDGDGATGD